MKKRIKIRKLSRTQGQRKALLKSLARSLFLSGRIKTTEIKAKEISKWAEKLITKAKENDIPARRYLARYFDEKTVSKLFKDIGPKYRERKGGCLRIIKMVPRKSDAAKMAIIELV